MRKFDRNNFKKDKVSGLIVKKRKWMNNQGNKNSAIGYCHNNIHKGYLTEKMVKQHNCIEKDCKYFSKYDNHPYWVNKRRKKLSRKINKYMNTEGYDFIIIDNHYFKVKDNLKKIDKLISDFKINDIDEVKFK